MAYLFDLRRTKVGEERDGPLCGSALRRQPLPDSISTTVAESWSASLRRSIKQATFLMCRRPARRDDQLVSAMISGYCCAAHWFASSLGKTNRPTITCIEDLIETRRSVVHRRSPAPAKTADQLKPGLAKVGEQHPPCRV
jgi:hypothetical protein